MVADLKKLSEALSKDTPDEKIREELQKRLDEIAEKLSKGEDFVDDKLGVRISAA